MKRKSIIAIVIIFIISGYVIVSGIISFGKYLEYEKEKRDIIEKIKKDFDSQKNTEENIGAIKPISYIKDEDILDKKDMREMAMIETISHVIWCENRSSKKSLQMVASVIYNRAGSGKLEDLYKVVVKPNQFECYSNMNIIASQARNKRDMYMLSVARNLVLDMLEDKFQPITKATHFIAPRKLKKKPSWVKKATVVAKLEGHTYMVVAN